MKKLILICLVVLAALPLLAQEDAEEAEPFTRADNECYAGGTMEGRCNQDVDGDGIVSQAEVDWAWNCGWYMARYNDGDLSRGEVPSWCASLLPPLPARSANSPRAICAYFAPSNYCLLGNYLTEDFDYDGDIDYEYYVITDAAVGNGGNCPGSTVFVSDVSANADMDTWLPTFGFSLTDDICRI
jgi:hypothetical protein